MNLKISLKQLAKRGRLPFYIDNDGRPIGETQCHVENVCYLLEPLENWFRDDSQAFVAGALVLHYEKGRRDRYLSPDVFVVRGVPKEPQRRNYLVWEEGKAPEFVVELTSESTRNEDQITKRTIYQDILRVSEYFLFDPFEEYLHPRLQGYRLAKGVYRPIRQVKGRLPSKVLGLHLEGDGDLLRLYHPSADRWLAIPSEVAAERTAEAKGRQQAEAAKQRAEEAQRAAEAEVDRLRRELNELRRRLPGA